MSIFTNCPPFITGSRAYGVPHAGSDTDLVLRVSPAVASTLRALSDNTTAGIRFGSLNLILAESDAQYDTWRKAYGICMQVAPTTHERACVIHKQCHVDTFGQSSREAA